MSVRGDLVDLTRTPPPWIKYPETKRIFDVLEAAGGQCRFVGGCVRDAMLGDLSHDLDVCSNLLPEDVMQALEEDGIRVIPTGIKHGTVTALIEDKSYEITTLRVDVETFGRHAEVAYTTDWEEDAARRDFTVNAMCLDLDGNLYDYFGGKDDLATGHIRFIGNADERIEEDRLRVFRYFRFYGRYGGDEPDTEALEACRRAAGTLDQLSSERVSKEMLSILRHATPLKALTLMQETGVLAALFHHEMSLNRLQALLELPVPSEPIQRLGALIQGDVMQAKSISDSLRLSAKAEKRLIRMCEEQLGANLTEMQQKEQLYRSDVQTFKDRCLVGWAKTPAAVAFKDYLAFADSWTIPSFPLKGQDLLAQGFKAGPEIGRQLAVLEASWIESDFSLTHDELLAKL